ncbi:predicted protein [Verticillium alfalfae VaMs.102]|uniref:Predicted protein n=1 Tax=Verticillium alfalfae (strain VaMs.102 / ATCC MYA-4576 / FGSC 10136) TaxID=526221 RepID=C9SK24_VERA1|nr:predicted protein [Verticillium alfalfae VaMs.102]EEY19042.1 predicted protein [Verticillium alfalfae VaMs.102]
MARPLSPCSGWGVGQQAADGGVGGRGHKARQEAKGQQQGEAVAQGARHGAEHVAGVGVQDDGPPANVLAQGPEEEGPDGVAEHVERVEPDERPAGDGEVDLDGGCGVGRERGAEIAVPRHPHCCCCDEELLALETVSCTDFRPGSVVLTLENGIPLGGTLDAWLCAIVRRVM